MKILWIAPLLLAGCGTPMSPAVYANLATQEPPARLCAISIYGSRNGLALQAARDEVVRRGVDCNQYRQEAALMYQERAQRAAQADADTMALSRQLLAAPPILLAPPPQQINCQTFRAGNTLQTNCR